MFVSIPSLGYDVTPSPTYSPLSIPPRSPIHARPTPPPPLCRCPPPNALNTTRCRLWPAQHQRRPTCGGVWTLYTFRSRRSHSTWPRSDLLSSFTKSPAIRPISPSLLPRSQSNSEFSPTSSLYPSFSSHPHGRSSRLISSSAVSCRRERLPLRPRASPNNFATHHQFLIPSLRPPRHPLRVPVHRPPPAFPSARLPLARSTAPSSRHRHSSTSRPSGQLRLASRLCAISIRHRVRSTRIMLPTSPPSPCSRLLGRSPPQVSFPVNLVCNPAACRAERGKSAR